MVAEPIKPVNMVENGRYAVFFTSETCPPCIMMYRETLQGKNRKHIDSLFNGVYIIDTTTKEIYLGGVLQEKQKILPTVIIYECKNNKFNRVASMTGYPGKDGLLDFLRKWKTNENPENKLDITKGLPTLLDGLFRR